MTESKVGERERTAGGWFGAPQEAQVPVRAAAGGGATATGGGDASTGSRWLRRVARVLRDAVIAVAIMALVPMGLVTINHQMLWMANSGNTRARLVQAEAARKFALPKDAQVTPMEAGLTLAALEPERARNAYVAKAFPLRAVPARAVRPWVGKTIAADMFVTAPPNAWSGPGSEKILEAAAKGLSPAELAYLKTVATAPLWSQYDLIARAPAVDILGGRFIQPFPDNALLYEMPTLSYAATKELAYAGVSRAAYHLAIGERAEAEAALKSIIGFGFALIDNGTFTLDGLIGRVIVGIGRDGLERFYDLTGDPRAAAVRAARPPKDGSPGARLPRSNAPTVEYLRERLLLTAQDPAQPRTLRYDALHQLSLSSCGNVRELVFGTGADIRRAYEGAARDLARYPSERAFLDLALKTTSGDLGTEVPSGRVVVRLLVGASTVAGVVLDNPRMPFCARLVTGNIR